MKKLIVYSLVVLASALSCAKQEKVRLLPPDPDEIFEAEERIPVVFGSNVTAAVVTKASVDVFDATQSLHIYGIARNGETLDFTNILINDVTTLSPAEGETKITVEDPSTGTSYYYDNATYYDFFGYYIGDITPLNKLTSGGKVTMDVTIDGSQDILVARSQRDSSIRHFVLDHPDTLYQSPAVDPGAIDTVLWKSRLYSSYAVRKGINPELRFRHLLSRFVFHSIDGSVNEQAKLRVDNLYLTAKNKGTLTVVGEQGLEPDATSTDKLYLRTMTGGTALNHTVYQDGSQEPARIGESIMVMPEESSYALTFTLSQDEVNAATGETKRVSKEHKYNLSLKNSALTKAGISYTVNITVYSLEQVTLDVYLDEWEQGETINIGEDE